MAQPPPQQPTPGAPAQPMSIQDVQEKIDQLYGDRHASGLGDGLYKGAVSVSECPTTTVAMHSCTVARTGYCHSNAFLYSDTHWLVS